ncbi:MAG TPA: SDR family NAD(P)-dependent oxidoreductase [Burkholderiales bacterium]
MARLQGRTALVTGANRGIGLAIAKELAKEGASLFIAGRNRAALEKVQGEIKGAGGKAEVCVVDLEDEKSTRAMAKAMRDKAKQLDIFIGNAASLGARVAVTKYPLDTWRQTFRINVDANLVLLQELDALLKKSDAPRIVMLSAKVATVGKATTGSYAVSKAALESMVRVYITELEKGSPLRINIVSPGPTRTEMRARAAPEEDPMTIKAPDKIAPLFVALSSPECKLQGQWIDADEWLSGKFKL